MNEEVARGRTGLPTGLRRDEQTRRENLIHVFKCLYRVELWTVYITGCIDSERLIKVKQDMLPAVFNAVHSRG